ncbi:MAG: hypothetical protein AAF321_12510, partial [Pseudomonadota bacterium]
ASSAAMPAIAGSEDIVVEDAWARASIGVNATKTISADTQVSAIDYNVFEGVEVKGLPRLVMSRGQVVAREGKVDAEPGRGQFIERAPNPPVNRALSSWKALTAPKPVARGQIPAGV